jgi:hypothetical protein
VALAVPESVADAVNVVVPHPATDVELLTDATSNVGSTRLMESVPVTSGVLSENVNEMLVGPSVTGLAITSADCSNAGGVGNAIAVDTAMVVAAMSFASARVTATVRVASFAPWFVVTALVVTPVSITTVHLVSTSMSAVPDVSRRVAVDDAEPVPATVNVVVPQPSFSRSTDGSDASTSVNVGSTRSMRSPDFSTAFSSNAYEIDDAVYVAGSTIVRVLCVSAGSTTAFDFAMSVLPIVVLSAARLAATLRVSRSSI